MVKKLAFALDVENVSTALSILDEIEKKIIIKVGYVLFIKGGKELIKEIKNRGFEVFLDLKLHDIPNTVYNGVKAACDLNVDYLTIHAIGGPQMMDYAVKAKENTDLKLLAVTILTSHSEDYTDYIGSTYSLNQLAVKLAKTAIDAGIDGIVTSAHEVKMLKESINKSFIAVVPGIRLSKEKTDDQTRIATPSEAYKNGADIIVVGRPILKEKDKNKIIKQILEESIT